MTSLIDRYVFTVLRHVPERQRTDIDHELRASIQDAVDARVGNGEQRAAAIEATLLELGDPRRLADRYADRPQYLIGPELFPAWRALMIMLFSMVLPIIVAVAVVLQLFDDPAVGAVIGTAISATLTTAAHLAFWTTGLFAILERTGTRRAELEGTWTLDRLPKHEPGHQTPSQLAGNLLWPVLLLVALVLQQFTFTAEPVLDPANWTFWWPFLGVVLVLECVYAVWVFRRGALTRAVTVANAVLAVLFAAPVVWLLATERFFNPEFLDGLGWGPGDDARHWLSLIVLVTVVISALWDIVDVGLRVERARRGRPTEVAGTERHTVGAC